MKQRSEIIWLALLVIVLGGVAAAAGVFWPSDGAPTTFTSLHGETVTLYGRGIYRLDTIFQGGGSVGTDVVVLFMVVPMLVVATWRYRQGSVRGGVTLMGGLAYMLYVYAHRGLSNAYNELFLLYVAAFSASFFAFVLSLIAIDPALYTTAVTSPRLRRATGVFMLAAALLTSYVWLEPLIVALRQHEPPALLDSYTTMVTDTLDLAIIVPSTVLAGVLILRRQPQGMLIAFPLLMLLLLLGPTIALQTVFQLNAGVVFTTAEIVGPVTGFLVFGVCSLWIVAALLRRIGPIVTESEHAPMPPTM